MVSIVTASSKVLQIDIVIVVLVLHDALLLKVLLLFHALRELLVVLAWNAGSTCRPGRLVKRIDSTWEIHKAIASPILVAWSSAWVHHHVLLTRIELWVLRKRTTTLDLASWLLSWVLDILHSVVHVIVVFTSPRWLNSDMVASVTVRVLVGQVEVVSILWGSVGSWACTSLSLVQQFWW